MTEPVRGGPDPSRPAKDRDRVTAACWRDRRREALHHAAPVAHVYFVVMARTSGVERDDVPCRTPVTQGSLSRAATSCTIEHAASPAGTPTLHLTAAGSAPTPCSANSTAASATPRSGAPRPANPLHALAGPAVRSLDIALDHAGAKGSVLGRGSSDLGSAQALLADSMIDIEASSAALIDCAPGWSTDPRERSSQSRHLSSIAKMFCSEAIVRVVDRAMQICGGDWGLLRIAASSHIWRGTPFRIYDGAIGDAPRAIARRASSRPAARPFVRARVDLTRRGSGGGRAASRTPRAQAPSRSLLPRDRHPEFLDATRPRYRPATFGLHGSGKDTRTSPTHRRGKSEDSSFVAPPRPPLAEVRPRHGARGEGANGSSARPRPSSPGAGCLPDETVLGVPFYLMEHLEGHCVDHGRLPGGAVSGRTIGDVRARSWSMLAAERSRVGGAGSDLRSSGAPRVSRAPGPRFEPALADGIQRELPLVGELRGWAGHRSVPRRCDSLVHGGFRLGNLMFAPSAPARVLRPARLGDVDARRPALRRWLPGRLVRRPEPPAQQCSKCLPSLESGASQPGRS